MKRKKPPIALITVLVGSILGLVIAGKAFSFYNLSMEEQQKQLQQEAEDRARANPKVPTSTNTKADGSKAVQDMKAKVKEYGTPQVAEPASMGVAPDHKNYKTAVPTIVMPEEALQKPKPNSSAPIGQWYNNK